MQLSLLLIGLARVARCITDDLLTPEKVEADIKLRLLEENLQNLSSIAQDNGGNRAWGLPGFRASVDFILSRTQIPEMNTTLQSFNSIWEHTRNISVLGPNGEAVYVISPQFNNPTPLPQGVTGQLVYVPGNSTAGLGCTEEQWATLNVTGKLPLIEKGVCGFGTKAILAKKHGAVGIIFYNSQPGTDYISPSVFGGVGIAAPAGLIPMEVGTAWQERLQAGENLTVTLTVDSISGIREGWNVIAETKDGDPKSVVMLGAHLDSVQRGPGINDDGSGSATLLEIMDSIRKYKGIKNKVRFAWWGAEESGLVGSSYYTTHLDQNEVNNIRYYFNYDMIGSPNPVYVVIKNNNSGSIPDYFGSYLKSRGKTPEFEESDGGSDYDGFAELGIPVSGLFTGAGGDQDPCYHRECDDLANISWEALTINAKAAGRALARVALSLDGVPSRSNNTRPLALRRRWPGRGVIHL